MSLYPYGYGNPPTLLPERELDKRSNWKNLHPEFRRRLVAMFDAAAKAGRPVGIGGGWRSSQHQENTFYARHERVRFGGCCRYAGSRWKLRKGMAHAAPPGLSYHESVPELGGFAVAADLIGDLDFANYVASAYGLVHFAPPHPLREKWHFQPQELPTGRSRYRGEQLTVWKLPDSRRILKRGDTGNDVLDAQRVMNEKAGQPIKVDGIFGAKTEQAVINVQRFFGLQLSAQVDPPTWAVLDFLETQ